MGADRGKKATLIRSAVAFGVAALLAATTIGPVVASEEESSSETPILPGSGITLPVLVEHAEPNYPDSLRRLGEQGKVTMQAVIRTDGTVGEIEVLSSNHEEFSRAAIAALQEWRYRPAEQAGKPIAVYYTVVVKFALLPERYASPSPRRPTPIECFGEGTDGPSDVVDEPPRVAKQVPVMLPVRLERTGGSVVLEFEVCRDGRVRAARVVEASDSGLGEAAVTAAGDWLFVPALRDGQPIAARHTATLTIKPSRE